MQGGRCLVFGGTGFVGRGLLQSALHQFRRVVGVSRRGSPGDADHGWASRVSWVAADALKPATYCAHIDAAVQDGPVVIISSIGILFESGGATYDRFNREW